MTPTRWAGKCILGGCRSFGTIKTHRCSRAPPPLPDLLVRSFFPLIFPTCAQTSPTSKCATRCLLSFCPSPEPPCTGSDLGVLTHIIRAVAGGSPKFQRCRLVDQSSHYFSPAHCILISRIRTRRFGFIISTTVRTTATSKFRFHPVCAPHHFLTL